MKSVARGSVPGAAGEAPGSSVAELSTRPEAALDGNAASESDRGAAKPRIVLMAGVIGTLAFFLALVGSLCLGSVAVSPRDVLLALAARIFPGSFSAVDPVSIIIVWELRLARTLLAGVAGASLGAAGAVLQGLFRNPLADPYALGVSSGASLGAVAAIALGISSPFAFVGGVELAAFAGAALSALIVYAIARAGNPSAPTVSLLLAGTAVGSFLSAAVSLIVSLNDRDLHRVFFWLLGGFGGKSWTDLATSILPALVSIALALALARPLDLLGAGEEAASSLGLEIGRARMLAVVASSLGAAAAVSAGGVIGFVGLLGPHIARLVVGPGHKRLIPASACAGAILLMLADAVARSVAAPLELPVGVVTALVGAPLFLRLLAKKRGGAWK